MRIIDVAELTDLRVLNQSFERALRAENRAARTIDLYTGSVRRLATFLEARGMPLRVEAITREHVEAYIAELVATRAANTAASEFRALKRFFAWLTDEGEIPRNPMERMRRVVTPEVPVPVLSEEQLGAVLRACEGSSFEDRRDMAMIRVLIDTGMRRAELACLKVSDIDFTDGVIVVMGTGRRPRAAAFGRKTSQALDRYLRIRRRHSHSDLEQLWVGRKGALHQASVARIIARRGELADIENLHPHVFRHVFAHVASPGRWRRRAHASGGMAQPHHASSLRCQRGRRARPRGTSPPESRGPPLGQKANNAPALCANPAFERGLRGPRGVVRAPEGHQHSLCTAERSLCARYQRTRFIPESTVASTPLLLARPSGGSSRMRIDPDRLLSS